MRVILQKDVPALGKRGEIKKIIEKHFKIVKEIEEEKDLILIARKA